jgi:predicted RNA polymerase sigma factor
MPAGRGARGAPGSVLHVLYLMFSEGYARARGTEIMRTDLSGEALR